MSDWSKNANSVRELGFSCKQAEKLYLLGWPHDKEVRARYETGRACLSCAFYAEFNADYGLCCNPSSKHHLQTMFEHSTCIAFEHRPRDVPDHVILPASDRLRFRKADAPLPKYESENTNSFVTDGFSVRETEKRFGLGWPQDPAAREHHDAGRTCSNCSWYAAFNAEWGLCCNPRAEAHLQTLSERFSCSAYRWREEPEQQEGGTLHTFLKQQRTSVALRRKAKSRRRRSK